MLGVPSAHASRMRPVALSNASHKLPAKAVDAPLERVAKLLVHPAHRGFMPGRGMITTSSRRSHERPAEVLGGCSAS